ncbi:MAG TPA: S41 family peptidase [Chroococcales cyanobacterium]
MGKIKLVSRTLLALAVASSLYAAAPGNAEPVPEGQAKERASGPGGPNNFAISQGECARVLARVDAITRKHFYDAKLAGQPWAAAVKAKRAGILQARNLRQLKERITDLLSVLHSSHCEFVTINDEEFYFLKSLFASFSHNQSVIKIDYTGAVTGGPGCRFDQVRYVLNGSPAERAGIKCGDTIKNVDYRAYAGQLSFAGRSGKEVPVQIERDGAVISLTVKPELKNDYQAYLDAIAASARIEKRGGHSIGYVHFWCAGHDRFEETLKNLLDTDALVLDLRDVYGGNSIEDLNFFYRDPKAYPPVGFQPRDGEKTVQRFCYTKPVVAIINGGSRSGKELIAFSLKRSGRARLVGEPTAGAVLAGRLFAIDEKTALYLAVQNVWADGTRLEGNGVQPDLPVSADSTQSAKDKQLSAAFADIERQLQ